MAALPLLPSPGRGRLVNHTMVRDVAVGAFRESGWDVLIEERAPRIYFPKTPLQSYDRDARHSWPGLVIADLVARPPMRNEWTVVEVKTDVHGKGKVNAAAEQVRLQRRGFASLGMPLAEKAWVVANSFVAVDMLEAAVRWPEVRFLTLDSLAAFLSSPVAAA